MSKARLFLASLAVVTVMALGQQPRAQAVIVAQWNFEGSSVPSVTGSTSGPTITASTGSGSFIGKNPTKISWGNTTGNGSNNAYQGDGQWQQGAYWEFDFSTTGFNSIALSFDASSKASGPRDFRLQTSTDGGTFNDLAFTYQTPVNGFPNPAWDSTTPQSSYHFSTLLPAQFENLSHLFIRLVQTSNISASNGTILSTGYSRIDNVTVQGVVSAVPEASSVRLLAAVAVIASASLFWKTRCT